MNAMKPVLILAIVVANIVLMNVSCFAVDAQYDCSHNSASINGALNAKSVLTNYLRDRSNGDYDIAVLALTSRLLAKYTQLFSTDYVNYYRNKNEDFFKKPKIIEVSCNDSVINMKVSVEVEGPGYIAEAIEWYSLIQENGNWKIDDWSIKFR